MSRGLACLKNLSCREILKSLQLNNLYRCEHPHSFLCCREISKRSIAIIPRRNRDEDEGILAREKVSSSTEKTGDIIMSWDHSELISFFRMCVKPEKSTENGAIKLKSLLQDEEGWRFLFKAIHEKILFFSPSDISDILYALKRFGGYDYFVVEELLSQLLRLQRLGSVKDAHTILHVLQEVQWKNRHTHTLHSVVRMLAKLLLAQDVRSQLLPADLQVIVSIYSRLGIPLLEDEKLCVFPGIAEVALSMKALMTPKAYTIALNGFAKCGFFNERFFNILARRLIAAIPDFTVKELALIANAYAKAEVYSFPLMSAISSEALIKREYSNAQDISNLVNAFAKLNVLDQRFFQEYAEMACELMDTFSPQAISNVANAYAKVSIKDMKLFDLLSVASQHSMRKLTAQGMGNLANAFSRLGIVDSKLFSSLADELLYRGTIGRNFVEYRFDIRSLDQLAGAFNRVGLHDKRVFYVISELIKQTLKKNTDLSTISTSKIDGYSVSNLLNAFGKSGMRIKAFNSTMIMKLSEKTTSLTSLGLILSLNACFRLNIVNRPLYKSLMKLSIERMSALPPPLQVQLFRAFSRIDIFKKHFVSDSTKLFNINLALLSPKDCITVASAYAGFNYREPLLMRKIAIILCRNISELSPLQLTNVISSFGRLRIEDDKLKRLVMQEAFTKQHEFTGSQIVRFLHSLILAETLNSLDVSVCDSLLLLFSMKFENLLYYPKELKSLQLVAWRLSYLEHLQGFTSVSKELINRLLSLDASQLENNDDYKDSKLRREFSQFLALAGLLPKCAVRLACLHLDVTIGENIAIELNGPYRFYRGTLIRTAASMLREKLIQAAGWRVVHVDYHDWELCTSPKLKILYCMSFWKYLLKDGEELPAEEVLKLVEGNVELLRNK